MFASLCIRSGGGNERDCNIILPSMQNFLLENVRGVLRHKRDATSTPFSHPQGSQNGKSLGLGQKLRDSVFWVLQEHCPHKVTAMVGCTRPVQDQVSQHSSMEPEEFEGWGYPTPEELWPVKGIWRRKGGLAFLRVWPLVSQPISWMATHPWINGAAQNGTW